MKKIVIIYIFLFTNFYVFSQNKITETGSYPFANYRIAEGIPQEDITCLFEDNKGYIWFGSYYGIGVYNGRSFKYYNTANGLSNNSVMDILQTSDGKIYVATLSGLNAIENETITFYLDTIPIRKLELDKKQTLWIVSEKGLYYKNDKSGEILTYFNKETKLPENIYNISFDQDNKMYFSSDDGLYIVSAPDKVKKIYSECDLVFIDKSDNCWISNSQGLFYCKSITNHTKEHKIDLNNLMQKYTWINVNLKQIKQSSDKSIWCVNDYVVFQIVQPEKAPIVFDGSKGLSRNFFYNIMEDKEHNIWFSFSGGAKKLAEKSLRIIQPDLIQGYVNLVFEDKAGRIWLHENGRIFYIDGDVVEFSKDFPPEEKNAGVYNLNNGNILFVTNTNLYEIDCKTLKVLRSRKLTKPLEYIETIFVSSKNEIFILGGEYGFIYYLKDFNSPVERIENDATASVFVIEEYKKRIIGGNYTGLIEFKDNTFKELIKTDGSVWGLRAINDSLWVGTEKGLQLYRNGILKPVATDIFKNDINCIQKTHNPEYILIGKNDGLFYYNHVKESIDFVLSYKDGLPGSEISVGGLVTDSRGLIWIGTYHGIVSFDMSKRFVSPNPPNVWCDIKLNGHKINSLPEKLNYNENNLYFELTAISFKDEKSIEYDFFLKGLENDYIASKGKEFKANYLNLPSGEYEFYFRAKGRDNVWSEYQIIKFEIEKPFWLKWWFFVVCGLILVLLVHFVMVLRNKALKKHNQLLEKMVEERTQEIQLQKNQIIERNEELLQQREEILAQAEQLEETNKLLTDRNEEIVLTLQKLEELNKQNERKNAILEIQNKEINKQKEELLQKSIELSEVIEELQTTTEIINQSNIELEKLSIVASKTENAVMIAESNGFLEWVNEGFMNMWGYSYIDFTNTFGHNFLDYDIFTNTDLIEKCKAEKQSVMFNTKTTRKNGQELWIQVSLTPILDDNEQIVRYIAVIADITKIKNAEREIEQQNKKITYSIQYARRIQSAILPPERILKRLLTEYFIIYKPKDIVSGDFFWINKRKNFIFIAVADCTGHGVPGAFMSILGLTYLNEILNIAESAGLPLQTNVILDQLREKIIKTLHQKKQDESKDGMDIALISFDLDSRKLSYSGANNQAYLIRKNELIELKPDKMPIGIYIGEVESFKHQQISVLPGDMLYMFTDGIVDQFGGDKGRKFLTSSVKKLFTEVSSLSIEQQKIEIEKDIHNWMNPAEGKTYKQLDDMLVFGVRL